MKLLKKAILTHIGTHTAILLFEDGTVFRGKAYGVKGTTTGEICFNTGMTGYQEVFTDPSYYRQLLVTTNAHIGNYGTADVDEESEKVQIAGLICKNFTDSYHRPLANQSIQSYFEDQNLICISDVDTRAIVRKIRSEGAMNALISTEIDDLTQLKEILGKVPSMEGRELSSQVSTEVPYFVGDPQAKHKVAVLDLGTKRNILNSLASRDCYLKVFPAKTSFSELKDWNPDAYFLSNGPGDPASMDYAIETAKQIINEDKAAFGICLGHQIIALAMGVPTYKMHHGHRGANHPVINHETGKCEITTQNHGFAVDADILLKLHDKIEITHRNLNDNTIEGIQLIGKNIFSVQYHPEAAPGPHDSRYLFDKFVNNISNK